MRALRLLLLVIFLPSTLWAFGFGFNLWFGSDQRKGWEDLLPNLSWSPTSYAFGNLTTGSIRNHSFTITNSGNDIAEDVAVTVTGTGFRLYSTVTMGNISSAKTRVAKVEFHPTLNGDYAGYVNYSAPNIGKTSAALTGSASGGEIACNSGTLTGGIDWITGKTSSSTTNMSNVAGRGNSFSLAAEHGIYSVAVVFNSTPSAGNTLLCRYGTTQDLTSTYIGSGSLSVTTSGTHEVVFDTHTPIAGSTTIYVVCNLQSATPTVDLIKTADDYTGGVAQIGSPYNLTNSTTDLKFQIKVCQ